MAAEERDRKEMERRRRLMRVEGAYKGAALVTRGGAERAVRCSDGVVRRPPRDQP